MDEKMYFMLLERSREFCKMISVHYIDFLHDVICENDNVTEDNYRKLFIEKKYDVIKKTPVVYIGDVMSSGVKLKKKLTLYKYCKHCDQILPDSEFPLEGDSGYTRNICISGQKDIVASYKKKDRVIINDRYIIDLLKKNGCVDISLEMIERKRNQLLQKRNQGKGATAKARWNKTYYEKKKLKIA